MSLRDLAEVTGLDYGYLSRLERGLIKEPGVDKLLRVAEALGVPLADVNRGEDVSTTATHATPATDQTSESELRRYTPEEVIEKKLMPFSSARVLRLKVRRRELYGHTDGGRITFTAEDIRMNAALGAVQPLAVVKPRRAS